LGTFFNDNFSPFLAKRTDVAISVWFSSVLCILSLFTSFVISYIDKKYYRGFDGTNERNASCADVRSLGCQFWLCICIIFLSYCVIVPFHTILSAFLQTRWYQNDSVTAGRIMGICDIIGASCVIPMSWVADKYGKRGLFLVASSLCFFMSQLLLSLSDSKPFVSLAIQGIGQGAYVAVVWPAVCLVVPPKLLG
jgi:Na+/melibiose symporter-like transporter